MSFFQGCPLRGVPLELIHYQFLLRPTTVVLSFSWDSTSICWLVSSASFSSSSYSSSLGEGRGGEGRGGEGRGGEGRGGEGRGGEGRGGRGGKGRGGEGEGGRKIHDMKEVKHTLG